MWCQAQGHRWPSCCRPIHHQPLMGSEWGREGQGGTLIPGSTARVWLGIINYKRRDMINKGCVIALGTKTSDQEARAVSDAPAIYCSCHRLESHISFLNLCKLERREIKKNIYPSATLKDTGGVSVMPARGNGEGHAFVALAD